MCKWASLRYRLQARYVDYWGAMTHQERRFSHHHCTHATSILERARLRQHFKVVLGELAAVDVEGMSSEQQRLRRQLIAELALYARTGRFPKNRDFADRREPYFVDEEGTRCAMAHLIESTGDRELVGRIARTRNHARVRELAGDVALGAWLMRAGLTAAEAARIQPSYCFESKADACLCQSSGGVIGVIEGTVIARTEIGEATIMIAAVHGDVGSAMAGMELTFGAFADVGTNLLVPVTSSGYGSTFEVDAAGNVVLDSCQLAIPELAKSDAIAALTAPPDSNGTASGCRDTLETVDPAWADSVCEEEDAGGCNASDGAASPLVLGAALLAATLWRPGARLGR